MSKQAYMGMARQAAAEYDLPPELLMGLIQQESKWNPNARSHAGAYGLTQIMPETAAAPGHNIRGISKAELRDPMSQIRFGARYLKAMLNKYDGDVDKALAAYNGGPGRLDKVGLQGMPLESREYVTAVKGYADDYSGSGNYGSGSGATTPADRTDALSQWDDRAYYGGDGSNPISGGYDGGLGPGTSGGMSVDRGGTGRVGSVGSYDGDPNNGSFGGVLGGVMGGAARGALAGGPYGALAGGIMGGIKSWSEERAEERAAAREEQGLPADDGKYGIGDAFSDAIGGFKAGGLLGAGASVVTGMAKNAWNDRREQAKAPAAGIGYSNVNSLASGGVGGVYAGEPMSEQQLSAALGGLPSGYSPAAGVDLGYTRDTSSGITVAGDDALSDALSGALGGSGGSSGSSYGGGGYTGAGDDDHGGSRGW